MRKFDRKSEFAGSWYPSDFSKLKEQLTTLLQSTSSHSGDIFGAILPHAGLSYSGRGMAHFFKNRNPNRNQILLLSPSHYYRLPQGHFYYSNYTAYQTPFDYINGKTAMQEMIINHTHSSSLFSDGCDGVVKEHAVELFFPFIKDSYENPDLTILLVPTFSNYNQLLQMSNALNDLILKCDIENELTIIASSDFTHYGGRFGHTPYGEISPASSSGEETVKKVRELDLEVSQLLAKGDVNSIFNILQNQELSICGIHPAMVLSLLMKERGTLGINADYYTSNDFSSPTGDFVAYSSILFGRNIKDENK